MRTTYSCALCSCPVSVHSHKEHIFPNAIGGRKTVRQSICRRCNNETGRKWDAKLVEQLRPICTQLEIKRQNGNNQAYPVRGTNGVKYMCHPGGTLSLRHPSCKIDDEKNMFKIQARSLHEANRMLRGLSRKYPKSTVRKKDASTFIEKSSVSGDTIVYESVEAFGGRETGRSVIKTCVAMAHSLGINASHCDLALDYLLRDGEPCIGYFNTPDVVVSRPSDVPFHFVWISSSHTAGLLVAYIEYFGFERILACLSESYNGKCISGGYAIDPISGKELILTINWNITRADIRRSYNYNAVDDRALMAALESVIRLIIKRRWDHELKTETMRAHKRALLAMGVPNDHALSVLSDGDYKVYSGLVAGHVTEWVMQYYIHSQRSYGQQSRK